MNIRTLLDRINNHLEHGGNELAKAMIWDPDSEQWEEISCFTADNKEIKFYSDDIS